MKKIAVVLAIALMSVSVAVAQSAVSKPKAGTITTEIEFSPFNDGNVFGINGINGRYFLNDKMAARLNLDIAFNRTTNHAFTASGVTPEVEQISKTSTFGMNFFPGIEFHFGDWEKVSLYAGGEIGIGFLSASANRENAGFVSGNTIEVKGQAGFGGSGQHGNFTFGMGVFTGVDVYVFQNLYMGAELGFGFGRVSTSEVEVTTTTGSTSTTVKSKDYTVSSGINFAVTPVFRLGWKF